MSGFAGTVRLQRDQAARLEDQKVIQVMAAELPAYDRAQAQVWSQDGASLCFAPLKTGPAPQSGVQPVTLDRKIWLLGDVRLDGRQDLISRLAAAGEPCNGESTDEELVLHAWRQWEAGERDKFHTALAGDFSFVLWQPNERRLTCFRDLMGSRAFFYAIDGLQVCFGNSLRAIQRGPGISLGFDYHHFGDYLLNGWCLDPARTAYERIKRLPAGHTLRASAEGFRIERFSSLPLEEPFRQKRSSEYAEEYLELLTLAVRERLPEQGATVFMSGGLDSTIVAATGVQIAAERGAKGTVRACTADYRPLFDDQESDWAAIAAEHMGVELKVMHGGEYAPFGDPELLGSLAEPRHEPYLAFFSQQYCELSKRTRVVLTGNGGDDILGGNALPHLLRLARNFRLAEAGGVLASYFFRTGKLPVMRAGIRTRLRRWFLPAEDVEQYPYPVWLNPRFEKEFGLRERWQELRMQAQARHPVHPEGYASLGNPLWHTTLENEEIMRGALPMESRAPLLDTRLLRFLLRVPPLPWCSDKYLLRMASKGLLPESVRKRAKTPLPRDPVQVAVESGRWIPKCQEPVSGLLQEMVDVGRLNEALGTRAGSQQWINHHPLSLELWLKMR